MPSPVLSSPELFDRGQQLMTEREAAAHLRVSIKTLQSWRLQGKGPRFLKLGRCVRYKLDDLTRFLEASARNSTSQPAWERRTHKAI